MDESQDITKGFIIKNSSDGRFLMEDKKWEEVDIENAHMFVGNDTDIEDFIKVNNLDNCEIYTFMQIRGNKVPIQRRKRIRPLIYKLLPWPEAQSEKK